MDGVGGGRGRKGREGVGEGGRERTWGRKGERISECFSLGSLEWR